LDFSNDCAGIQLTFCVEDYMQDFDKGDLIGLRENIPTYPLFKSVELFKLDAKLNIDRFSSENLIVVEKIKSDSNLKEHDGYRCLCNDELVYVFNLREKGLDLDVGFCYQRIE